MIDQFFGIPVKVNAVSVQAVPLHATQQPTANPTLLIEPPFRHVKCMHRVWFLAFPGNASLCMDNKRLAFHLGNRDIVEIATNSLIFAGTAVE